MNVVNVRPARGPSKFYCPYSKMSEHYMVARLRGGALLYVRQCQVCGWIDFDELDDQVHATVTKALRWYAAEPAQLSHLAPTAHWEEEAKRWIRTLAEPSV